MRNWVPSSPNSSTAQPKSVVPLGEESALSDAVLSELESSDADASSAVASPLVSSVSLDVVVSVLVPPEVASGAFVGSVDAMAPVVGAAVVRR